MISIARIDARGRNQQGAPIDYLFETEKLTLSRSAATADNATSYYLDEDGGAETMRWGGKLALDPDLMLAGKTVERDDMLALAKGFSPTGKALCQNAGEEPVETIKTNRKGEPVLDEDGKPVIIFQGGHRVGFDLTFSAPKPVSVAFAMADNDDDRLDLVQANLRAAQRAMDFLEGKVETRRGAQGKNVIGVKGLIYSQHLHASNRNLEPNLHVHTLVYGVAKGEDDQWSTFDARELYRHRMAADQIYRNELAMEMRALGYGIEQQVEKDIDGEDTGRTWWTIAGLDDKVCETFSTRTQELRAYALEHGVDRQTACLATRKHKDEPTFEEMRSAWTETLEAMKAKEPELVIDIHSLKGRADINAPVVSEELMLERLHEKEAMFCEHHLIERIGMEYSGRIGFKELMDKVETFKSKHGLVRIQGEDIHNDDRGTTLARIHTEDRYAAPWMVDREKEILHRAQARHEEQQVRLDPKSVERTVEIYEREHRFQLSDEQKKAVNHITVGSGGVCVLSGLAGTGKTTVAGVYSQAFKAEGKNMIGVAISNAAAKKLEQESGMPCASVAKTLSLLDRGRMTLTKDDVVVLDEAGMVDTDSTRRLMSHCDKARCKLILQGDANQLQPVAAGSGMLLAKEAVGDVKLTEIRRQKRVEDRKTAKSFYDQDDQGNIIEQKGVKSRAQVMEKSRTIYENLDDNGQIDEYATKDQAQRFLVKEYLDNPAKTSDKLILVHTNAEADALNALLREQFRSRADLAPEDVRFKARRGKEWHQMNLAEGDLIRFTTKDDVLGVLNGTQAQVEKIAANARKGGFDLTVRIQGDAKDPDTGRELRFNTNDYNSIAHRYANTIHVAQGQGKPDIYHLLNLGMADNSSTLVAFTRLTSGNYKMYGASGDIERLEERLGLDRLKGNAIQAGLKESPVSLLEAEVERMFDATSVPVSSIGAGKPAKVSEDMLTLMKQIVPGIGQAMAEEAQQRENLHELLQARRGRTLTH